MANQFVSDAKIATLMQSGLLEKLFNVNLRNELNWRSLYTPKYWADRAVDIVRTKRGTMAGNATPLAAGVDPSDGTYEFEQWPASIAFYGDSIPTDLVTSGLTLAELLPESLEALARSFARTMNTISRYPVVNAALAGQTTTSTAATGQTKAVASINGFCFAKDSANKYSPVSAANTLKVWVYHGAAWAAKTCTGVVPATPGYVTGPGDLTFSDAGFATIAGDLVVADTASARVIAGGGLSVDTIGATDFISAVTVKKAVARLKYLGVPTFDNGSYKLVISPNNNVNLLNDTQILLAMRGQGLDPRDLANPNVTAALNKVFGCTVVEDAYADPATFNVIAKDYLDCPTVNAGGTPLAVAYVVGKGGLVEDWREPVQGVPPSGYNGTVGEFGKWKENSSGVETMTDRARLILRAPLDKEQRVVSSAWGYMGGYNVATDFTAEIAAGPLAALTGSNSAYKRYVAIVSAQ